MWGQPPQRTMWGRATRPSAERSEARPTTVGGEGKPSKNKLAFPPPAVETPVSPFPRGDGGREDRHAKFDDQTSSLIILIVPHSPPAFVRLM
jgi:hypothetical protein